MFRREHPARPAESGENLIGDQERAVPVAEPPDAGQELARPDDHSARSLEHGFDQHSRDRVCFQRLFEAAEAIDPAARALEPQRTPIAVPVRQPE